MVAAAAPLAAMVGNLPLALSRGNGAGLPGAFLLATLTLLCFAVGYAEMSERVVNTGAFYTYVALGLGKPTGVGAAFIAMAAYLAMTIGMAGAVGYFIAVVAQQLGVTSPGPCSPPSAWPSPGCWATADRPVVKILGALMIAEIGVLAVFDGAVVVSRGLAAAPAPRSRRAWSSPPASPSP